MFDWLFKKKHKVQVTRTIRRNSCPKDPHVQRSISEEVVNLTENGLVYFCVKTSGCYDKIFINYDNTVRELDNSEIFLGKSHSITPLTWRVDEPCPLFKEEPQ